MVVVVVRYVTRTADFGNPLTAALVTQVDRPYCERQVLSVTEAESSVSVALGSRKILV